MVPNPPRPAAAGNGGGSGSWPDLPEDDVEQLDLGDVALGGTAPPAIPAPSALAGGGEQPLPVFADVTGFVEEFFAPVFGREVDRDQHQTWCPEWWRHPEGVYRLESLWRSWEQLRLDLALGSAVWLRDHLDHQLPILLASRGPFHGCSVSRGHDVSRDHALPVVPADGHVPVSPDPGR